VNALSFHDSAAGIAKSGKNTLQFLTFPERSKNHWRFYGFYRQMYEKEEEGKKEEGRQATFQVFLDIFLQKQDSKQKMQST